MSHAVSSGTTAKSALPDPGIRLRMDKRTIAPESGILEPGSPNLLIVIPAKAGTQRLYDGGESRWIPAFAGTTG
jgi:hypothetical protein